MSEVDFDAPNAETAPPDETDAGPGMMIEMWDAVTEGTFDNLRIDTFFVILFISMVLHTFIAFLLCARQRCLCRGKFFRVRRVLALSFS